MALPATDSFTGTDGTALSTYSASWTTMRGSIEIQSNTAEGQTAGGSADAFWNADTFSNDQYSQLTATDVGVILFVAPSVRASGGGGTETFYQASFDADTNGFAALYRVVNGSATALASITGTAATDGDTVRCEAEGTTIRAVRNGSTVASATDASISSGAAGLGFYGASGSVPRGDDWEGGDLGGGGGTTARPAHHLTLLGVQ